MANLALQTGDLVTARLNHALQYASNMASTVLVMVDDLRSFIFTTFDPTTPDMSIPTEYVTINAGSLPTAPISPGTSGDLPTIALTPLSTPTGNINPGNNSYTSDLLNAVKAKLLSGIVTGGTGLSSAVETAIWERENEREQYALQEAMDKVNDEWAKRNFSLPTGALAENITSLVKEYENRRLDRSRDIAIKQAELEQANLFKMLEGAIQVEMNFVERAEQQARRTFEASKAVVDAAVACFDAAVKNQALNVDVYKAKSQVYIESMNAMTQRYNSDVQAFNAKVQSWAAAQDYNIKVLQGKVQAKTNEKELILKEWEILLKNFEVENTSRLEALKSSAAVLSQVAAGSLAGASASASLGYTAGDHWNNNTSKSTQTSTSKSETTTINITR